jgi:NitT/TauT family transport system substrate-binding protein
MCDQRAEGWTRRRFLGGLTLAGTAGLLGLYSRPIAAEPPPETTRLRLLKVDTIC